MAGRIGGEGTPDRGLVGKISIAYSYLKEKARVGIGRPERTHIDGDPTEDALISACQEARDTLDHQVRWLRQIDQKAISVLRTNVLLLGLILTALSILFRTQSFVIDPYDNLYSRGGIVAILLSTSFAGLTYLSSKYQTGLSPKDLQDVYQNDYTMEIFRRRLAWGYTNWVAYNKLILRWNALLVTLTILLALDAVILLTGGAYIGTLGFENFNQYPWHFKVFPLLLLVLNWIVFKIDYALEVLHTPPFTDTEFDEDDAL